MARLGLPLFVAPIATVIALLVGMFVFFRLFLPLSGAAAASGLVWLWPPVFGMLPWVGRDVWLAAILSLWLFALTLLLAEPNRNTIPLGLACVTLACFAFDARQNALPVFAITCGVLFWRWARPRRGGAGALVILYSVLAAGAFAFLAEATHDALGVREQHPEQTLHVSDLVGMSVVVGEVLLPKDLYPTQNLKTLQENRFTPLALETAGELGANPFYAGPVRVAATRAAWFDAIMSHPTAYLQHRFQFHLAQLGFSFPAPNTAYFVRSDSVDWERSVQLQQAFPSLNEYRLSYLRLSGDPIRPSVMYWPIWYLVAGLGAATALLRQPRFRQLGVCLITLQVTMQAVLALTAPVIEYRLNYYQVVLGLVLLLVVSCRSALVKTMFKRSVTKSRFRSPGYATPAQAAPSHDPSS